MYVYVMRSGKTHHMAKFDLGLWDQAFSKSFFFVHSMLVTKVVFLKLADHYDFQEHNFFRKTGLGLINCQLVNITWHFFLCCF